MQKPITHRPSARSGIYAGDGEFRELWRKQQAALVWGMRGGLKPGHYQDRWPPRPVVPPEFGGKR
jgi:hypothetical protein